jgi:hypothetical protein
MNDALVVDGGPNRQVAANMLADLAWPVTVLGARPVPDGEVGSRQPAVGR